MWSAYVYDKENNQINWLDSWPDKEAMIRCAKENPKFYLIECYETPNYFEHLEKLNNGF